MMLPGLIGPGLLQFQAAQNTCAAFFIAAGTVWYPRGMTESLSALHPERIAFPHTGSVFHA